MKVIPLGFIRAMIMSVSVTLVFTLSVCILCREDTESALRTYRLGHLGSNITVLWHEYGKEAAHSLATTRRVCVCYTTDMTCPLEVSSMRADRQMMHTHVERGREREREREKQTDIVLCKYFSIHVIKA